MKLRFLGTGTSFGVPVVGCGCATCHSVDPRDRRTRHGAVLQSDGHNLLIDTPPELRLQLVEARIGSIDAVWYTHFHADHIHGVDDLRIFSVRTGLPFVAWGSAECVAKLGSQFPYVFDSRIRPVEGTSKPEGELRILEAYEPTRIGGFEMLPLPVPHGTVQAFGFRVGDLGYITDAKELPERTRSALEGVTTLVLNALWFDLDHPTHFNVEEAVEVAREIGAERTYLTHISHLASHTELEARLPQGVMPAYDGLVVEL